MSQEVCEIRKVEQCLMDLLHAVQKADISSYLELVSENVSCFEPETHGHLLKGIGLHRFLVEESEPVEKYHIELVDPAIRINGDMAYVAYTLLLTELHETGETIQSESVTRIFEKQGNAWKMIHFHRSKA